METLYVSDLDGTLLRNDTTLSEFSRRELCAMIEEGIQITVASARSVISMKPILGMIPFRLPVVEGNGSYVSDYETGRHLAIHAMDTELALEALSLMSEGCAARLRLQRKEGPRLLQGCFLAGHGRIHERAECVRRRPPHPDRRS
jgi:hydroxymethylpyrimidine pyrophosphatase-like HAD family hydrolase